MKRRIGVGARMCAHHHPSDINGRSITYPPGSVETEFSITRPNRQTRAQGLGNIPDTPITGWLSAQRNGLVSAVNRADRRVVFVEMFLDDPQVARVRPEQQIERVPRDGNRTEQRIDHHVPGHAPQLPFGQT